MARINLEDSRIRSPIFTGVKHGVTILAGTGNATLTEDMGPVIYMAPTANRVITLPVASTVRRGLTFYFINGAAFTLTVQSPTGPTTVGVVPATVGALGMVVCLGGDETIGLKGWAGGL